MEDTQAMRVDRKTLGDYLRAGARMVWVVDPEAQSVTVHRPGQPPEARGRRDLLRGERVVLGFSCEVADLFG